MTYTNYEWTAFTEADFLGQGGNGSSIGCGDSFTMPASASVCMSTYDNDSYLSGDTYCNENANDGSGQYAYVDGARVGSQMYAEQYHVLQGSDGQTYYMIEIEVEGYNAPGEGEDYFTFYGAVPPEGVELTVVQSCNVRGCWVDFDCIGAGDKAPANTPPTFTNVPEDGIICVDENTTFVIDLNAEDLDGDTLTYEIVGGRDAEFFEIDPATGELTFKGAPDYENPQSGGDNNTYDVTVKVSDGQGGEEIKPLWVKVKDVEEGCTDCECIVIEAEDMHLCGYQIENNDTASGGQVVKGSIGCWASAKTTFQGSEGEYDLKLSVIDENDGQGWVYIYVNGQDVSGPIRLDQDTGGNGVSNSSFREIVINDLQLSPGDEIKIWGKGEGCEFARLDKIELCKEDEPQLGAIGDTVWFDADKDGVQDADEAGIEGITVNLKDADGNVIATTITDADGNYLFSDLAAGDYSVAVVPANGLVFTAQDAGGDDAADSDVDATTGMTGTITLGEGETNLSIDAGLIDPGTAALAGRVFCDENDNDVDDGEPGVAGVSVDLLDANGVVVASTVTGADGSYEFTGLDAGTYSVDFDEADIDLGGKVLVTQDVGGDDTIDSDANQTDGTTAQITLGIGERVEDIDAGVEDPATAVIKGRYFCDENDNDVDDDEPGIAGAEVKLLDAAGNVVATQTTDSSGNYAFTGLLAGTYAVMFAADASGKVFVAQDDPNGNGDDTNDSDVDDNGMSGPITVGIGETSDHNDAGVEEPINASIAGRVFCDTNFDAQDDNNGDEPAVAGVTVELLDSAGTVVATRVSDANGEYLFDGLAAGDYKIRVPFEVDGKYLVAPNQGDDLSDSDVDWITGESDTITLAAGEAVTDVDAGLFDPGIASLSGRVFCDENDNDVDDSEPGVAGVSVVLTTAAGAFVASTTTAADGSYSFSSLFAGDYKVQFFPEGKEFVGQDVGGDDTIDSDADQVTGMTGIITVGASQAVTDVDAGVEDPGTASLGDRLFYDFDGNGLQDADEEGVAGVIITLCDADGNAIATTTTDSQGNYLFENLYAGDYSVQFTPVPGYSFTLQDIGSEDESDSDADATGKTGIITLGAGEQNLTIDAGIVVTNTAPEANDDAGKICANEELMLDVLVNDSDAEGQELTVTAVNGVSIIEGDTINIDGVLISLTDGKLVFDAETALVGLNIGEEQTINYTYTVEDSVGAQSMADIAATFCGTAETVAEVCASLPATTNYQIVTGIPDLEDASTWSDIAFDIQLTDSGDARLDGLVITDAYCLSFDDPAVGGATFAEAPVWSADLYCADPAELPSGFFNADQIGSNGETAIDNLDLINYILNQDYGSDISDFEVQSAIWSLTDDFDFDTFLGDFPQFGEGSDVDMILADAIANGEGFQAGAGDVIGLIVDPNPTTDENSQPFIIGVEFDNLDCLC